MPRHSDNPSSEGKTHKGDPANEGKSKADIKNTKYTEDRKEMKERKRIRQEYTDGPDEPRQDKATNPNRNTNKPKIDKQSRNQS